MLPKAHLTLHSKMSGSRWVITLSWLSRKLSYFLYSSSVYSCHLFLISSASVRSVPFSSFIIPIFAWNVLSQYQGLFQRVSSLYQVAKVLKLQHQSFQWIYRVDFHSPLLVSSPSSSWDSQESSPAPPQFKSINSLALNLLYGPTFVSIHDYWRNHLFDYEDHCWQSPDVSAL